jgi:pyruvate dehydrogenase E1 component beta subunit
VAGLRPVAELQFSGFSYFAFHQVEAHAARMRWRTGGGFTVPMVIRMPYGAGVRALEHHSESREVYYAHTPGLKTVIPSSPATARGLLKSAVRDPDPVVFLEPKFLYRAGRMEVDEDDEPVELGRASVARTGDDITFVGYGAMVPRLLECAERLAEQEQAQAEVIDLLSLSPLDDETICESVKKTGRVVIVHEAPRSYGPAGEITSRINERCFYYLKAPVCRVTGYDIVTPYFARERYHMPSVSRIHSAATETLEARP